MNGIFIKISPIIILLVSIIFIIRDEYKSNKKQYKNIFYILLIALIFNTITLSLLYIEKDLFYNTINYNHIISNDIVNYFLIEIILIFLIIILYSEKSVLMTSHNQYALNIQYIGITISLIGLFITENILIISFFYIWTNVGIYYLFFFGDFKKSNKIVKNFKLMIIISSISLMISNLLLYLQLNSFNLDYGSISSCLSSHNLIFAGFIIGFGLSIGLFPFIFLPIRNFLKESNSVNLRLFTSILAPISGILIIKLLYGFFMENNNLLRFISIIGIIGVLFCTFYLINILFSQSKINKRSIFEILGILSIIEFNILLILGRYIFFNSPSGIIIAIYPPPMAPTKSFYFIFLLAFFGKSFIFEALKSISGEKDIEEQFKLGKFNEISKIALIFVPILYFLPYFLGSNIIDELLFAKNWYLGISIILYFVCIILLTGNLLNAMIINKNEKKQEPNARKASNSQLIWILFLILILILLFIFDTEKIDIQNFFNQ